MQTTTPLHAAPPSLAWRSPVRAMEAAAARSSWAGLDRSTLPLGRLTGGLGRYCSQRFSEWTPPGNPRALGRLDAGKKSGQPRNSPNTTQGRPSNGVPSSHCIPLALHHQCSGHRSSRRKAYREPPTFLDCCSPRAAGSWHRNPWTGAGRLEPSVR